MRIGRILSKPVSNIDAIDIEILLTKILNITRATLKAYPERELNEQEQLEFNALLQRRIQGEPIAYLIGHKEFWSLDFMVTPDVLIPRSDTELLVEIALEMSATKKNLRVLDLGTGSGAIALSIASEMPDALVIATDVAAEALNIAKLNAKYNHITNVEFALGNWFEAIDNDHSAKFNMILSNPPYIADFDPHLSCGDLRFEPSRALVSGTVGMDALNIIISQSEKYLLPDGVLIVEHGYDQEALVTEAFIAAGFSDVTCYKDLAGIPRVTYGILR